MELDDALEMRRRVLLAFEAAERESDEEKQRRLLTFVIVGGGPTGVELCGALAELVRQAVPHLIPELRGAPVRILLLEALDHRFLNKEVPEFFTRIPTTENLTIAIWQRLSPKLKAAQLHRVRVYETPDLFVDFYGEA